MQKCVDAFKIFLYSFCLMSKNNGQMIDDLSEQYLVDCANGYSFEENDMEWTADGCAGAWPMPYFDFLKKTNGGKILRRKKTISISLLKIHISGRPSYIFII